MTTKTGKATPKADADEEAADSTAEEKAEEKAEESAETGTADDAVDDAAAEKPPETETEPTTQDRPKGRRGLKVTAAQRSRMGTVLVLLVLVATTVTATLQWREANRLSERAETEQRVRTRAAEFGQALLAYRHNDLNSSRARIRQLTATDFGRSYEAAFDGLANVIGKYKADATASVRDTYINQIDGDRAKALVVLDSEVKSTTGTRRVLGSKLLLELVREKGQWRVSGLVSLEADDETMTKPDGTPASPNSSGGDSTLPGSPETKP